MEDQDLNEVIPNEPLDPGFSVIPPIIPQKPLDPDFGVVPKLPPLPFNYNEEDERVEEIIKQVSEFCGMEFTEVPPNPEAEDTPIPLAEGVEDGEDEEDEEPQVTPPPLNPGKGPGDDQYDKYKELIEQYKEAKAKNLEEKTDYWAKLWQVIRFISNITCWTDQVDDTFFMQTRVQQFSIEQVCGCRPGCCHCNEDEIVIPLDYSPVPDKPFVDGRITVFINGKPISEEMSQRYLNTHFDMATNTLHIMRGDFPETLFYKNKCCCLCRRKATVMLHYNAGYDHIPAGLLPMICPLLSKIEESKAGLSECANTMTQVAGLLKAKKVGNIQYEWSDKDSELAKTQALYTELYNLAAVTEVYSISRCYLAEMPEEMGDVV